VSNTRCVGKTKRRLNEKAAIGRACKQWKVQNPPVSTINDTASSSSMIPWFYQSMILALVMKQRVHHFPGMMLVKFTRSRAIVKAKTLSK